MSGALVTVNGVAVSGGAVTFPLVGTWHGELEIAADSDDALTGAATLSIGGVEFVGFATPGVSDGKRVTLHIVGGAGGLGTAVEPQHYDAPTYERILSAALAVGGESLSATSDGISGPVRQWTRAAGVVSDAVRAIADDAGLSWRVIPDGSVWVGSETWDTVTVEHVLEDQAPTQSCVTIEVESASVLPGVTFLGSRVTSVVYRIGTAAIRAEVYSGTAGDELAAMLGTFVDRRLARVDYHAPYVARVLSQNADDSCELRVFDARIPSMSRIPIRPGVAGVTSLRVAAGTDCVLMFEDGKPSRPVVTGFVQAACTSIAIDASSLVSLGDADSKAARADLTEARLQAFAGAFLGGTPVPADGGAAIQTAVRVALAAAGWNVTTGAPPSVASSKVEV